MNRTDWWFARYLEHVAGDATLPTITKLEVALHTDTQGIIDNENTVTIDIFPTELSFADYSRKQVAFNAANGDSTADIKWYQSVDDWNSIAVISIVGTCLFKTKQYKKSLWWKQLDNPVSKLSTENLFIGKALLNIRQS